MLKNSTSYALTNILKLLIILMVQELLICVYKFSSSLPYNLSNIKCTRNTPLLIDRVYIYADVFFQCTEAKNYLNNVLRKLILIQFCYKSTCLMLDASMGIIKIFYT